MSEQQKNYLKSWKNKVLLKIIEWENSILLTQYKIIHAECVYLVFFKVFVSKFITILNGNIRSSTPYCWQLSTFSCHTKSCFFLDIDVQNTCVSNRQIFLLSFLIFVLNCKKHLMILYCLIKRYFEAFVEQCVNYFIVIERKHIFTQIE